MNAILDIDVAGRTATVQPGVINGDLAAAVAEHGLWYVPDPGSRAISSIGGNLATNAGGTCCAKYGVTADHVARIKAVLADGRTIHTGAVTRKNVAGPEPDPAAGRFGRDARRDRRGDDAAAARHRPPPRR